MNTTSRSARHKTWIRDRGDMLPYQHDTVKFMHDTPRSLCCLDMGLGKTVSAITHVRDLFDSVDIKRVLVVAPLRVATATWPTELKLWEQGTGLSTQHISLPKHLDSKADIHITSRDSVRMIERAMREKEFTYDIIVVDESSSFRNPTAKRWKQLVRLCAMAKRVVLLTATPAPNGYQQLWAQIFLLDFGKRLGTTYDSFLKRYYYYEEYGDGKLIARKGAEEAIANKIADITYGLRAKHHIAMPELVKRKVQVDLGEDLLNQYAEFEISAVLETDMENIAFNLNGLVQKLQQFTAGHIYLNPVEGEARQTKIIHDAKLDKLAEMVEEYDQPVLVSYQFQSDLKRLKERFPDAEVIKSPLSIVKWNRGEIKMGLVYPGSAGLGLNLQDGGSQIIFYSMTWDAELYIQLIGRLHRQGQKASHVVVHHLVCEGTIDEVIFDAVMRKERVQDLLLDRLAKKDLTRHCNVLPYVNINKEAHP